MATNQGPSSTQDNEVKKPYLMPIPDNTAGNESGVSDTAGRGTTSGQQSTGVNYKIEVGNDSDVPNELSTGPNDYSHENRSAKYKNPSVKQDQGAGAGQYE